MWGGEGEGVGGGIKEEEAEGGEEVEGCYIFPRHHKVQQKFF